MMIAARTMLKVFKEEGCRVFALALLASLLWHIFWISTITIVSKPGSAHPVKFSKVSFLGPLLGRGAMELQARPKESSFLEKRYLDDGRGRLSQEAPLQTQEEIYGYAEENDTYYLRDEEMVASIDEALSGEKFEPSPGKE